MAVRLRDGVMRGVRITAAMADQQVRDRINAAYDGGDRAAIEDELVRLDEWTRHTGDGDPGWAALRGYARAARELVDAR